MSALVGNSLLWYGLALKIAMTASIVVAASVVVERSGPFVGARIAALPAAGGAAIGGQQVRSLTRNERRAAQCRRPTSSALICSAR